MFLLHISNLLENLSVIDVINTNFWLLIASLTQFKAINNFDFSWPFSCQQYEIRVRTWNFYCIKINMYINDQHCHYVNFNTVMFTRSQVLIWFNNNENSVFAHSHLLWVVFNGVIIHYIDIPAATLDQCYEIALLLLFDLNQIFANFRNLSKASYFSVKRYLQVSVELFWV